MKIKNLHYIVFFIILVGCRNNDNKNIVINDNNIFINEIGNYTFRDYNIIIKQFKDGSFIYGIFGGIRNECLYQQNLEQTFNNYSKWTFYIDEKDRIWFYNSDRDEITVFSCKNNEIIYESHKNKLPPIPKKLEEFIKS